MASDGQAEANTNLKTARRPTGPQFKLFSAVPGGKANLAQSSFRLLSISYQLPRSPFLDSFRFANNPGVKPFHHQKRVFANPSRPLFTCMLQPLLFNWYAHSLIVDPWSLDA
jgi:hypothetical protein